MKAVLLHQHGPVENLQFVTDHPTPEPGPSQVRVKIMASALNRLDIWVRDGWPGLKLPMPHILGSDGAGLVDALGPNVTRWQIGQRVSIAPGTVDCEGCEWCDKGMENLCDQYHILGETTGGTYCEYIVVKERDLLPLPDHMSFEEGAAAGLVFVTAWHSLIVRGNLRPGESVLIIGAGGGVNTASIQIAKLVGCEVYVVGSSDEKLARAKELGADHLINRTTDENWGKAIFKMTNRRGVDVVVDNVGAPTMMMSIRAARKGGRVITVGNTGGPIFQFDNRYLFFRSVNLIGSTMGTFADYRDVMALIAKGKLKPVVGPTFALEDITTAHRKMEADDFFGKIILKP